MNSGSQVNILPLASLDSIGPTMVCLDLDGLQGCADYKNILASKNSQKSKKYLLIGDMLELGKHSKRLHKSIAPIINKTKINKVFVMGNNAKLIFQKLSKSKKGRVLNNWSQIIELIRKDLNDNDYLMIKASNATGFSQIVKDIKGFK